MSLKTLMAGAALLSAVGVALGLFYLFGPSAGTLRLPGVVESQEVRLGSKIGGRVDKVTVVEGAIAEPGETLVTFAVPELEAQRQQWQARVLAMEADLDKAKNGARPEEKEAALQAAKAAHERYLRLKAGSRPEEIRQARSELESAEADVKMARDKLNRTDDLYRKGVATPEEQQIARSTYERMRGQVSKAQSSLDLLLAGSRKEDIAEAAAQAEQAQANYEVLRVGTRSEDIAACEARVTEARGKLREIEANLQEAVVRAPERVVVEVVAVRKGDLVAPNQPILRVLRADDLWVRVYVPETELGKVSLNDPAEVTIDAYPERRFSGTIMQISSASEFTPRNVQSADERRHQVFGVKVHVPDPQGVFKSGMAAEVTIPLK